MRKPYFLTRQTANLMEDFVRDLKSAGGVYLLYGDEGVGKTRLLEELSHSRLQDVKVHWIDLKAGSSSDGALVDSSVLIEDTFAGAKPGDVIIADHFEMALKKTRHQLFLSWSTDGADKQVNLIVAGNTSYFNELRQLAQQYQLRAQSFQQMPFSHDEAAAFLGFYLFPDRPIGKLSVPPLLRNQIAKAQGNVGKIVEIAERAGDQISSEPLNETESTRKGSPIIIGAMVVVAVIFVGGWYFLNSQSNMEEMPMTEAGSPVIIAAPPQSDPQPAAVPESNNLTVPVPVPVPVPDESIDSVADEVPADQETNQEDSQDVPRVVEQDNPGEELMQVESPALDDGTETEIDTETETETATEEEAPIQIQSATASVDELRTTPAVDELQSTEEQDVAVNDDSTSANSAHTEPESAPAIAVEVPSSMQAVSSRVQRDLQTSRDWINSRDSAVGTLQIMLLSQDRFDDRVYYEYLDRLSGQGVDISELKILATYTGNQDVFSVVFGEYQNREAAKVAMKNLPQILRDIAPIPRSVGGLMTEMRRLEGQN